MTEPQLAELFAEQRSTEVVWRGRRIHSLYEPALLPDAFSIEFLRATTEPTQGVVISLLGGELEAADGRAANIVLWHDSAPPEVRFIVARRGRRQRLQIWNVWRGPHGATMAWLGNAAIDVDVAVDSVVLRCSDGVGGPDFDDLHVRFRTI